ncbi:16S rRNA (cytosine(1402)-N(4))-methyltransferase RsmH [Lacihabitans soyangensis]|uniref:Ribosomal RNA small subunit methyltransferase H n=2 Tax=Lacihabitans soyangensis TaxID=869394 RepID=A0AAE3H229_9BACT|nr:16S rRNA (cytosine(1402)-N(4))-methyltransferase RsmH [Lacihabitans soyangensis]
MLKECLEGLNIKPDGIYVDVTFGGGGHSRAILEKLTTGHLYSFDQDDDAKQEAAKIESENFTFISANFRFIKKYLRVYGVKTVDGILADLGISSHQIDTADRGFSTRFDAELDMRMDVQQPQSAKTVVNEYSFEDLHKIFGIYGELKNARTVAQAVVSGRGAGPIETIRELKAALQTYAPRGKENKFFAQVFQALRIEVNEELKVLEEFLQQVPEILSPDGRLVMMSYHSLEDRPVKNFIRSGKFFGEVEKDLFGNEIKPLHSITRKPVEASEAELLENPRARSAKLRIAQKLA